MAKAWKERERVIAKLFGTKRTPLSGLSSGHTSSDTLHKEYYIEVKHSGERGGGGQKQIAVKKDWLEDMAKNCKKEKKKLAFLVFHYKGDTHNYAVLDLEDLRVLLDVVDLAEKVAQIEEKRDTTLLDFAGTKGRKEKMAQDNSRIFQKFEEYLSTKGRGTFPVFISRGQVPKETCTIWTAACLSCGKIIDEDPSEELMFAMAQRHKKQLGCKVVLVGYRMEE